MSCSVVIYRGFVYSLLEIKTNKILCLIKKHLIFHNYLPAFFKQSYFIRNIFFYILVTVVTKYRTSRCFSYLHVYFRGKADKSTYV